MKNRRWLVWVCMILVLSFTVSLAACNTPDVEEPTKDNGENDTTVPGGEDTTVPGGEDTTVPVENSILLAAALAKNKIPFEMHIYPYGGHGISLANQVVSAINPTAAQWFGEALRWMGTIKAPTEE